LHFKYIDEDPKSINSPLRIELEKLNGKDINFTKKPKDINELVG